MLSPAQGTAAEEMLLRGVPTQDKIIDALKPGTRGIRPTHTPDADKPRETAALSMMVLFEYNSADLTPTARAQLDQVGKALMSQDLQSFTFQLEGHTDAAGGESYNLNLSQRRARAVYEYLITAHGIEPSRLKAVGKGESNLFDPGHPLSEDNRRVRIINLGS